LTRVRSHRDGRPFSLIAGLRLAAVLALLCHAPSVRAQSAPGEARPGAPRLGLWIECEGKLRTLDDGERLSNALDHAAALGATDLFVQVFRDGRAWFATQAADETPWRRARGRGFDPLGMAIRRAHARGARVHAWVNLLRVGRPAGDVFLRRVGEDAVLSGTGPGDSGAGWTPDTPGAWLDPTSPEVGARLASILSDLVRAYPTSTACTSITSAPPSLNSSARSAAPAASE
jgi:uncharacterized lipoprotein YddW (UPF0748 family)